jgi:hypothetical protein
MDANPNSLVIILLSALASAVYQTIKLHALLLPAVGLVILLLGTNINAALHRPKNILSGAYIIKISVACLLIGPLSEIFVTRPTINIMCHQFLQSYFLITWCERTRIRNMRVEEERNQLKNNLEKELYHTRLSKYPPKREAIWTPCMPRDGEVKLVTKHTQGLDLQ